MKIPVNISRIPSGVSYFDKISSIELEKEEIFKLGIFKHEVPAEHLQDSDYLYLMSKVSAYIQLYSDFIEVKGNSIINTSHDDRVMKDVSEIVGIALGIKFTIDCFGVRQEIIAKIPPPTTKKKYLDYSFVHKKQKFELETKGTTSKSIQPFVNDITEKKAASTGSHLRYGTVAVMSTPGKSQRTELHICDDPPETTKKFGTDNVPWHYISALGHIIDNKYYNQIVHNFIARKKSKKGLIKIKDHFFGEYVFKDESYFGEFFDYRVNFENLSAVVTGKEKTINDVFRKVTEAQGNTKIFIGIHHLVVDLMLNGGSLAEILELKFKRIKEQKNEGVDIFRDSDGIVVVTATNNSDPQINSQFSENEVKNRVGLMVKFERHEPTECGAPCKSRGKKGKPCEIKTYRGTCHFHR